MQGLPVFASAKAFSASTAHCTASTALPNSTRTLSQENRGARIDVFANYAISDLMVARPAWADSGLKWFEVFDKVDIAAAQRQAKLNRDVIPQRYGVASVLLNELHREFEPPAPPKPNRKAEAAAARATRDAALLARIESRLELGRKLVALRDATPSHRKFGRAVRKQGFHDPQDVAEMQRVVRLYGDRPDVTGRVRGWHVLAALSSPLLSESARRKFEARIMAGENVTAKVVGAKRRKPRGRTAGRARPSFGELRADSHFPWPSGFGATEP